MKTHAHTHTHTKCKIYGVHGDRYSAGARTGLETVGALCVVVGVNCATWHLDMH